MIIGKKTTKKDVNQFIENTADSKVKTTTGRAKKVQFSHTIDPEILEQVEVRALEIGLTRASLINLYISMGLKKEL